jgi:hypothetical protein
MIVKCESQLFMHLDWKTLFPTCLDILRDVLYLADPDEDNRQLLKEVKEDVFHCLVEPTFAGVSYSSLALACLFGRL